jgi:hypothetical protein
VCLILPDPLQFVCPECGLWRKKEEKHGRMCYHCNNRRARGSPQPPSITTEQQVTSNASQLMNSLPQHSHHRAPLLATLSQGLPSSTAAQLFGASASYVRDVKSKGKKRDWKEADLFQEK